jgi:DNA repair exonuclease SbcCD ATPase subunit
MLRFFFHLSDLHIRNGDIKFSRFDEYNDVFHNTIASLKHNIALKKLSFHDFLIIITGDIFHNKNNVGNYGLLLYKNFITQLTNIGRVIIIHGNHDKIQSELNQPSLVFSSTFHLDNLTILNDTSSFVIDDIGFSYVAVDDTLDFHSNTGRLSVLSDFPIINAGVKYKVALFHGSFSCSKLYNGDIINEDYNPYPLEWIQDFHYALLGDIHKRQVALYKGKTLYGYSGSLIQQNFGEDILDHGYLIWDLYNKDVTEINVFNNIGYINIKQVDEEIYIRTNGKYDLLLENVIKSNLELFPKTIHIKAFSTFDYNKLHNILHKYDINYSILSRINDQPILNNSQIGNTLQYNNNYHIALDNVANDDYILSYFNKLLSSDKYNLLVNIIHNKESLLFNLNKYPEDLHEECSKKNKEITSSILSCNKSLELNTNKSVFLIRYLEWDGLLCYENKNWINMHNLDSKTFMVKGKNGTGKSAIYDIMLLAIWGDNTKMKVKGNTSLSAGIINNKKEKAYTVIDIELNGKIYRIERDFNKRKDNNLLHVKNSVIYKFENDNELVLLKKESACNEEVKKLFGTIDDFLTTSMITQNVDNDILKFDSKKCLELIDKSYNIDYIYNLYNLFKLAVNKYRDFYRTIENKKQVYQKLVSSNQDNDISEEELNEKNNQLNILNDKRNDLLSTFNSIVIDIKNPIYITILNTEYDSLIKSIVDSHGPFNDDDMKTKKNRYNELALLLKDKKNSELLYLNSLYSDAIQRDVLSTNPINKPCELSVLLNEQQQLKDYLDIDYTQFICDDIVLLEEQLNQSIIRKSELESKLSKLISSKPTKVDNPNLSKDDCHNLILKCFKTIKEFHNFVSSSDNKNITTSDNISNIDNTDDNNVISYNTYKKLSSDKILLEKKLSSYNNDVLKLDEEFKTCFNKQKSIITVNKPTVFIANKKIKPIASSISATIDKINIELINNNLHEFEQKLSYYNELKNTIRNLESQLSNYIQEHSLIVDNDDYKYNPECEFCCKRPWVNRIKELHIIIDKLQSDIKHHKSLYDDNHYQLLIKNIDNCNNNIIQYDLLIQWLIYYKYKEAYDAVSNDLNNIIAKKEAINDAIIDTKNKLHRIHNDMNHFNIYVIGIYNIIRNIDLYLVYKTWEEEFNEVSSDINKLLDIIHEMNIKLNYNKNIKPRISKYHSLKYDYDSWNDYDSKLKIVSAHEFILLKEVIDAYDKYTELSYNNNLKPLIQHKMELHDLLKDNEKSIKLINDEIIKFNTLQSYNIANKNNLELLFNISNELSDIINTLDTIIINFQAFRIELYNKHILNNLVLNANKIIATLCHSDTKPFQLDYFLNVSKDIIHINWLINDSCSSNKMISITQSSGFQHFTIALAIRMCLFLNKNNLYCNQLFIDEGFVSFDRYNLSIVPDFLKNLLSYFHSIFLVSHIDLIQDNVDDSVTILYNNANKSSIIHFDTFKNVIKKRKRVLS